MKLQIPYSEAMQIAKEKSRKEISLSAVNDKTIKVTYKLEVMIPIIGKTITKDISLDVTYKKLVGEDLHLSFDGGFGLDKIIEGIMFLLPQVKGGKFYELKEGNIIVIHLEKIEKAHKALESISIKDVSFGDQCMELQFCLK